MAHWHDFNPWANELLYLPDWEEVLTTLHYTPSLNGYGNKFDVYMLKQPDEEIILGIRFGPRGGDYLSCPVYQDVATELWNKYYKEPNNA